ncbi:MAG: aromatic ring-hydroxylating dioxygenase subunit alpha [Alphaproteobacteria bacterium]|nr:aromatic ring-hydroxylating dioxygenase subunit alpha [Alphaproteobacteria bacterium]
MYLRNAWYVAAMAHEVGRTPLARLIAETPIVLYRTEAGGAVALHDLCIHRKAPLSLGRVAGDAIVCGYHGFTYDGTGACIRIPGQDHIPARARVRAYPVVERWGWLWLWLGDPAAADAALIPGFDWLDLPGWVANTGHLHLATHYQLAVDNLLDLSHETFLHARTIGNAAVAEAPITTHEADGIVHVRRIMKDVPPPPLFVKTTGSSANIDRYQLIEYLAPCYVRLEVRGLPVGSNDPNSGLRWWVLNALAPETARTTNYYWGLSRNFAIEDTAMTAALQKAVELTFSEDVAMLEAQQAAIERDAGRTRQIDARLDGGTVLARKRLAALIAAEARA